MQSRPEGVTAIAGLLFVAAGASVVTAAATALGLWPLAWGRYVVGELVTMGPAVFAVAGLFYALIGLGLLRMNHWARRAAIVVGAIGLAFLIVPISSAVVDFRVGAIAVNGAQIIVRVVVLWYLLQQHVVEAFTPTGG